MALRAETAQDAPTHLEATRMKRGRMQPRKSKQLFRKTAAATHKKNLPRNRGIMRGGMRL